MSEESAARTKRRGRSIAILVAMVVFAVVVVGLWLASRPAPEQLQGMVDADEVNVGTKALARVERLIAEEGQRVQAGTLLATLSSPEIAGSQGRVRVPLPEHRAPTDWERGTAGLATASWITADLAYRRAALSALP